MHTTEQVLAEAQEKCRVAELERMVARLAHALHQVSPNHPLPVVADQFLARNSQQRPEPDDCPELDAGAGFADGEYSGPERRKTTRATPPEDAYTIGLKAIG